MKPTDPAGVMRSVVGELVTVAEQALGTFTVSGVEQPTLVEVGIAVPSTVADPRLPPRW
jgi:hypothetical protein